MSNSATLERADNLIDATTEAQKFVKWALKFDGVDAHIVYDSIPVRRADGSVERYVSGALRGVTLQWDHDGDGNADAALHVAPGGVATRTGSGFEVDNPEVVIPEAPAVDPEVLAAVLKSIGEAAK